MTSNLGCVGLAVEDAAELAALLNGISSEATLLPGPDGRDAFWWSDASGASLYVTTLAEGGVDELTPAFDGGPRTSLTDPVPLQGPVVGFNVMEDGELATRAAFDVVRPPTSESDGLAAVTALGVEMTVHGSEAEFAASDASLLNAESAHEPRPDDYPDGVAWPVRMGTESFISFGIFGEAAAAEAYARLSGTVLDADTRVVDRTGQSFHAATVRTVGMQVTLCLAASEHPQRPRPGEIVSGIVYLVAALPAERSSRRRRWFGAR